MSKTHKPVQPQRRRALTYLAASAATATFGLPTLTRAQQAYQDFYQLNRLGVQTRLRNEEWKVFVQNRRQRVITQVFRGGWIGDVADPRNFLAAFASDGALNWMGWQDPGFTRAIARSDAARSEQARLLWLHAAETRLVQAHAVIPLYHYTSKHLVDPRVDGFLPNPLDRHATRWMALRP